MQQAQSNQQSAVPPVNAAYLTEEQIEIIAERAAEVALEKVYMQIGKSVVHRVLWAIGVGALAFLAWTSGYGPHK